MSGWGNQGNQGHHHQKGNQGWGNQPNQGWGNQPNQGWGNQPNQPNQGWGNQPNQGWSNQPATSLFNAGQEYLIITALDTGKVADVSQGNDRNKLILWTKSKDKNQRYRFNAIGNGKYQILSSVGGTLQIPNASGANGVQAMAGPQCNSPSQYWDIYPAQGHNGGYYIKSFCGKMLDVKEQKDSKGTAIIQWDYNGGKNQVWFIQAV